MGDITQFGFVPKNPVKGVAVCGCTIRCGSVQNGLPEWFDIGLGAVTRLDVSPDGKLAALVQNSDRISLWDLEQKRLNAKTSVNTIRACLFSPNGDTLWVTTHSGLFAPLNTHNLKQHAKTTACKGSDVQSIKCSPNGKYLATGSCEAETRKNYLELWDVSKVSTGGIPEKVYAHPTSYTLIHMAFSPDSETLVVGDLRSAVAMNAAAGKATAYLDLGGSVDSLNFTANGTEIMVGMVANHMNFYDLKGKITRPRLDLPGMIEAVHPLGHLLCRDNKRFYGVQWFDRQTMEAMEF